MKLAKGLKIWLQGGGEMASGVAVALVEAGCSVVIAELDNPCAVRRLVSFSDAIYEGSVTVSGITAHRVEPAQLSFADHEIGIAIDPLALELTRLAPDVVVDARMTKRRALPLPIGDRPLIGLGPGFQAGENANLVVETMRGPGLGQVLHNGAAQAYTGVPGEVGGQTARRLLRAPAAGNLISRFKIGDRVQAGEVVAEVAGKLVVAQLEGILRGLVHSQAELFQGQKVGDVDPRGAAAEIYLQSDKAVSIGAGVRRAVMVLCSTKIDR